jgi:dephospho-CoA kinase
LGSLVGVIERNCLEELGPATLQDAVKDAVKDFRGANLVFLDIPVIRRLGYFCFHILKYSINFLHGFVISRIP